MESKNINVTSNFRDKINPKNKIKYVEGNYD